MKACRNGVKKDRAIVDNHFSCKDCKIANSGDVFCKKDGKACIMAKKFINERLNADSGDWEDTWFHPFSNDS